VGVGPQVALLVYSVIGDSRIALDTADKAREEIGGYEELQIRL